MLRRGKRGFTLIELMVVVVIIGVLAVIGLRAYVGQVDKAKDAVTQANVGTIQTLIQGELASRLVTDLNTPGELTIYIFANAGIYNPVTRAAQNTCPEDEAAALAGEVWVAHSTSDNFFVINGRNAKDDGNVFVDSLRAIK